MICTRRLVVARDWLHEPWPAALAASSIDDRLAIQEQARALLVRIAQVQQEGLLALERGGNTILDNPAEEDQPREKQKFD